MLQKEKGGREREGRERGKEREGKREMRGRRKIIQLLISIGVTI